MTYGQRFHELRAQLWKGTVLALAKRLGSPYPTTIYNIERQWRVPSLPTLMKHATALGCGPWDLLENVETEYDLVRQIGARRDASAKTADLQRLLARYRQSTTRVSSRRKQLGEGHVAAPAQR